MKSELKRLPKSRIKIDISLSAEEFKKHYEHALEHFVADVKLPGFRKGKAPAALVERSVGKEAVVSEAIEHAIPDAYYAVVQEQSLHPLQQPHVTVHSTEDGLTFIAEVDLLPEVVVKNWRNIKVKAVVPEKITDENIEKVLKQLQKERAELGEAERPLQNGDFAHISYRGTVGGIAQEGMSSEHHPLVVGDGTLIPGFEHNLVGMQVGETKEFNVTFPKDYHQKSLAKKQATFVVTLDDMKELKLPELSDRFAEEFGQTSIEQLRGTVKEQLESEATKEAERKTTDAVLAKLAEATRADLPDVIVNDEINRLMDHFRDRLGIPEDRFAAYLEQQGKTPQELRDEAEPQARTNALVGLALSKVMEDLELDVNEKGSAEKAIQQLVEHATRS